MKSMFARSFNCMIELWETENVSDGFGGSTVTENLIGDIFARREQNASTTNYDIDGGVMDKQSESFYIRMRDIDTSKNFIIFNDYKYTILSFTENQLKSQIKLICVNTNTVRI